MFHFFSDPKYQNLDLSEASVIHVLHFILEGSPSRTVFFPHIFHVKAEALNIFLKNFDNGPVKIKASMCVSSSQVMEEHYSISL